MIAKMIKGKGFRGALEYDLRKDKGYILDTNMAGDNPRSLAREFGEVRSLRPNLTKVVCHVSLSIGPDERFSDDQWREAAQKYLEGMGFNESQYVVTKHTDTEHPHVHILVNRVTMRGSVVSDSHDFKRQETIMRGLELEFGLRQLEPSKDAKRKSLTKGEIERVLRTGEASVRMRLQEAVDAALNETTELTPFIARLAECGIETKLNKASTDRICGISFSLSGVAMKGSDLGKAYTWNSLQKRGLQHEQTRDGAELEYGERSKERSRSPEPWPGIDGNGSTGNALEPATATRHAEIEKQRRIDKNFERIAHDYQGCYDERTEGRTRSKGLSR